MYDLGVPGIYGNLHMGMGQKAILTNIWGNNHPLISYFKVPRCQGFGSQPYLLIVYNWNIMGI